MNNDTIQPNCRRLYIGSLKKSGNRFCGPGGKRLLYYVYGPNSIYRRRKWKRYRKALIPITSPAATYIYYSVRERVLVHGDRREVAILKNMAKGQFCIAFP